MNRRVEIIITVIFIAVIFSVGIVQAIYELKKGESVQFLDPLEDTFITPLKKRKEIASLFQKIKSNLANAQKESVGPNKLTSENSDLWESLGESLEETIYAVDDIKNSMTNVNRHKKRKKTLPLLDSLTHTLNALSEQVADRAHADILLRSFKQNRVLVESSEKKILTPFILWYPTSVVKTFIFYTIFNREYLREYEDELEKTSLFANKLRPPMQLMRYLVLKDLGDKAIAGRNKWLFYKPGFEYLTRPYIGDNRSMVVDAEDKPIKESAIDTIVAFKRELEKHGVELVVVIVPGKASVYPDLLSSKIKPSQSCKIGYSQKIIEELNKHSVETVNLFKAFSEARKDDAKYGDSLYLAQDTHWKTRGLKTAAESVASFIRTKPWFAPIEHSAEYILDTLIVDRIGDVGVMSKLTDFNLLHKNGTFFKEKTTCYQVYKIKRDEDGIIRSKNLFRYDFRNSKVLVIGDSFSRIYQTDEPRNAGWISYLAYELSIPLCAIISDGGASTLVREKLARKKKVLRGKKLVVWEFVERDLRYGAEGWKDIKL